MSGGKRGRATGAGSFLLLVRHAKAEDAHVLGDHARALTAEGRTAFREHARMVAEGVELCGILTSPRVRAVQTAELLGEIFAVPTIVVHGSLDLEVASPPGIAALAKERGPGWALVGHNPSLAEAVPHLLGLPEPSVRFRKGAIVAVQATAAGGWKLGFVAAPGKKVKRKID